MQTTESVLKNETEISLFENIRSVRNGRPITIIQFFEGVKTGKWKEKIERVRKIKEKKERDKLKAEILPYVTISGTFSRRENSSLLNHSGRICIDLDGLTNVNQAKEMIKVDPYTYAVFISASGKGLAVIIKIDPEKHLESFLGLEKYYLDNYGYKIDESCKDVSRARFVSYDLDLFINPESEVFKDYITSKVEENNTKSNSNTKNKITELKEQVEYVVKQIEAKKIIFGNDSYPCWRDIGFSLAECLGEEGREFFHRISAINKKKYNKEDCDKQYDACLNGNEPEEKISVATFFHYAKEAGLETTIQKTNIKTLIDSNADYHTILKSLCDIPWEGKREEWINYFAKKRGNIDKRAIRKDIKQFFKQSIIETKEETQENFTEEEKEKAIKILKSPNLLELFLKITSVIGLVRERVNKLCLYLAYTSRLLKEPISATVLGQSSSGKSHITNGVLQFFPGSAYLSYSSITPQSLYYLKDKELKHKILVIFERAGSEKADYSIRTFISEKELKILYVTKDPRTGEMVSKDLVKEGPISFIETSSDPKIHTDNLTRVFALYVEENPEKIKAVLEETARGYIQERPEDIDDELRVWQCLQTLLEPYKVKIPYASLLVEYFPTDTVRVQRDFKRFLALIEASCLLHQYQREENGKYIIATIEDYRVAYDIGKVVLSQTLKEVSPKGEELLEIIKVLRDEKQGDYFSFTRKDIEARIKWEVRQINRCLKELTTRGYCGILEGGRGKPYIYSIEGEVKIRITLPTPDELNKMLMGLSNCPAYTQPFAETEDKLDKPHLTNLDQPVQPTHNLDNLDKAGQTTNDQLNSIKNKDLDKSWTPGHKGKQDTFESDLTEVEI